MNCKYLKSKSFLVPTAGWAALLSFCALALGTGERKFYSLARTLIQWDGQHYLSIARDGYEKFPCPTDPTLICGNVGWFPVYPVLGRLTGWILQPLGLDITWALLLVSALSFWIALLVLFRLVEVKYGRTVAVVSLLALMLFPSSFYYFTAFPYGLYLLLAVLVFRYMEAGRHWWAALPAGLLAVTYPSGIVIALPLGWLLVSQWKSLAGRARLSVAACILASGVAVTLYFGYNWLQFDDFWLYLRFQSKPYYAHSATIPLIPMARSLLALPVTNPVFLMLALAWLVTLAFYHRRLPVAWQLYMFGLLLFTPAAGTTVCYYRHIVVAFPLFVMVGMAADGRRRYVLAIYAVICLILMWWVYLKTYKLGLLM